METINYINQNIKTCAKMLNSINSKLEKKPLHIDNFTINLEYKNNNSKCCKCNRKSEYHNNNNSYCWIHSQNIVFNSL